MEELLAIVIIVILLMKYSKSIKNSAQAADYASYAWSEQIKVNAIKDVGKIQITEEEVDQANKVMDAVNKFKL